MDLTSVSKNRVIRFLSVIIFFFVPLIFFTNLTRNPYFFQITILNISVGFIAISILYLFIKNKKIIIFTNPAVKSFIFILLSFLISSIYSYLNHIDFYKPSMISEFRRVWLFTIFNSFLPFLIAHYILDLKYEFKINYGISFIFLWGSSWFLFPFLKSDNIFWDAYGFILWGWAVAYLYFKNKEINLTAILNLAMLSGFYASVYGVLQYFGIEIIWSKVLNPYGRRAVSTFGNPNFVSSYVLVLIPFAVFYLLKAKDIISRVIYSIFVISYVAMIFASLTRSTLIGLFFMSLFLFAFNDYRKFIGINLSNFKKVFIIIFLILFLWPDQNLKPFSFGVISRIYEGTKNSLTRLSLNIEKKDVYPSFHQRLLIWSCGIEMFRESPVLGNGWGSFELFYPFYQGEMMRKFPVTLGLRTHANNAHNEIIEIISQSGLIGFGAVLLFVFYLVYPFLKKIKEYEDDRKIFILTAISSFLSMIVDNMLNVSIHFAVPAFLFFFISGIISRKIYNDYVEIKKYIRFISSFIFIVVLIVCWWWFNQFMREIYYFNGFKEIRRENLYEGITNLEKAYKYNKSDVNNNYELANAYARINELNKAIFMYEESLKANAGYDEIYFNLGVIQKKIAIFDKSLNNFKMSLWINPLNDKAYYAFSEIMLNNYKGREKDIINILEDGIKIHKYNSYIYNMLGYSYETIKNYDMAEFYYRKAVENDPLNTNYKINYKRVAKNYNSKIDIFTSLYYDINVKNSYNIDDFYKKINLLENEFGKNPKFMFLKARYYFEKGDYQKSLEMLNDIMEMDPSFASAIYSAGLVYEKLNRLDDAINMYENYLKVNPQALNIKERIEKLKKMK